MKKKKTLLLSGGLLTLMIVIITIFIVNQNNSNNEIVMQDNNKQINNSFLTLMLEQEDGTYEKSTSNTWPGEGYIFNGELSSCQNGGELDYDSENNKVILYNNKSDGCYIYFDLYTRPVINSINLGEVTNNSITISVSVTEGTNPISNYYYIINNETPISTTSNSYTFSGLNAGEIYTIKVYVVDSEDYSSDTSSLSVETENTVLLVDYIKNIVYQGDGVNGLYYHDGQGSYTNADQEAEDNSYRYSGANPNNYVCFGSDAATCPSDNLYRMIGAFDDDNDFIYNIKLIKADYTTTSQSGTGGNYYGPYRYSSEYYIGNMKVSDIASYNWGITDDITWDNSDLNLINLNDIFYKSFSLAWQNKIDISSWKIEGGSSHYVSNEKKKKKPYVIQFLINQNNASYNETAKYFYAEENAGPRWNGKIGLMYISDYGYASNPSAWISDLGNYDEISIKNNNWMYLGLNEWTVSHTSGNTSAISIDDTGFGYHYSSMDHNFFAIRPCFYLNSNVTYVSGSGTQSDPIRIN